MKTKKDSVLITTANQIDWQCNYANDYYGDQVCIKKIKQQGEKK